MQYLFHLIGIVLFVEFVIAGHVYLLAWIQLTVM
jgi:hypothetical protein